MVRDKTVLVDPPAAPTYRRCPSLLGSDIVQTLRWSQRATTASPMTACQAATRRLRDALAHHPLPAAVIPPPHPASGDLTAPAVGRVGPDAPVAPSACCAASHPDAGVARPPVARGASTPGARRSATARRPRACAGTTAAGQTDADAKPKSNNHQATTWTAQWNIPHYGGRGGRSTAPATKSLIDGWRHLVLRRRRPVERSVQRAQHVRARLGIVLRARARRRPSTRHAGQERATPRARRHANRHG